MLAGHANERWGEAWGDGWDVRWFAEVDSTNRVASGHAQHRLVVAADHQTAGRGRFDRRWEAPAGSSLLMSVVLRPPPPLAPFAVGVAAAEACEEVAGVHVLLKWPNDLVVADHKLGGILGERSGNWAVIGLGLNVNWGDAEPPAGGTSLDRLAGRTIDRLALLAAVLRHLDAALARPDDPDLLLASYRDRSATLGRHVRIDLGREVVEARAVDITTDGHLVLDPPRVISAGDVVHCSR